MQCACRTAVLLVLVAGVARAGFDEGMAAARHGDFATAIHEIQPLADKGDASAQYTMGTFYDGGYGVTQDHAQAAAWYEKAASQGNVMAEEHLSHLYDLGEGVPQDTAKAVFWLQKAVKQDSPSALVDMGNRYYKGDGVPQDYKAALTLWKRACDMGGECVETPGM